jgi:hypothetical protein
MNPTLRTQNMNTDFTQDCGIRGLLISYTFTSITSSTTNLKENIASGYFEVHAKDTCQRH